MVRAVACEARGPGLDSNSDQMFFSLLGYKEVGKMDPDTIYCVILRIHVVVNYSQGVVYDATLPAPLTG